MVDVDFEMTPACRARYAEVVQAFTALTTVNAVLDITSTVNGDRQRTRSAAAEE